MPFGTLTSTVDIGAYEVQSIPEPSFLTGLVVFRVGTLTLGKHKLAKMKKKIKDKNQTQE